MSVNKVILIGRLGKDPETRHMPNGDPVCNFSIATSESWKDTHGNKVERTEWHNITIYRKLAEICQQYLQKGSQVYLEGKIQSRKYTDKQGIERISYDIICDEMKMLGSKTDHEAAPQSQNKTPPPPPSQRQAQPTAPVDDIDDDVPF